MFYSETASQKPAEKFKSVTVKFNDELEVKTVRKISEGAFAYVYECHQLPKRGAKFAVK
jgi:hypothetical protein